VVSVADIVGTSRAAPEPGYRRRQPESTLLHETVRENLKTFLARVEERGDGIGLPRFVICEFERYLACGILANGFARVRCTSCGDEMLVAFSCKGRGFCPSCTTRRMQGTATHLLDRVLPRVPMRQWVLSLPRWARFLLARDPRLITLTLDRALRAIFAFQRGRARRAGASAPRTGAVSFVQRFGGALNLNVHSVESTIMQRRMRFSDGARARRLHIKEQLQRLEERKKGRRRLPGPGPRPDESGPRPESLEDATLHLDVGLDVPIGSRDALVPEHVANDGEIAAGLEHSDGSAVAQGVGSHVLSAQRRGLSRRTLEVDAKDVRDAVSGNGLAPRVAEDGGAL
jgi:hypothetical protein